MTAILTARDLAVVHDTPAGPVTALADASLALAPGEVVVVTGPSGAGKTTLLHVLGGIERPSRGEVEIAGQVLGGLRESALDAVRREQLGFVFQSFGLLSALSAAENVEVPLRIRETDPAERDARVRAVLKRVGLADHAEQRPGELSGGQQQRVGIARALVAAPPILLADEPTGQLDSASAERMMSLFLSIAHDDGVAVLLTTHDPSLVERADRALELHDGVLRGA